MRALQHLTYLLLFVFVAFGRLSGQTDQDTTVYEIVPVMPRFPACEQLDTTLVFKQECAQQQLLSFMYQNIVYPLEARQNGNEGMVVVSFVVEKDGSLSDPRILKDIGGGCGIETVRVVNLMNSAGIPWIPGEKDGQVVRCRYTLPIKFKLEEQPPYTLFGTDTIYTEFDTPLEFKGGEEALSAHLQSRLKYPAAWQDSCLVGNIDIQLWVGPTGKVRVLDLTDFAGLGFDFWFAATEAATSTYGLWELATFEGRVVPAAYDISLTFFPEGEGCKTVVANYDLAINALNEGIALYNAEKQEEGIAKMTEAVNLFPNNANFLLSRGQAYMNSNQFAEACADLRKAKEIAQINWYDNILPLLCR